VASLAAWVRQRRNGTNAPSRVAARRQAELRAFLELFVLCGFAVTQPVLDVTGRSPEFFLFNRASRGDILLLVAAIALLPALAAWAGELLVGLLGRGPRRAAHLAVVAGLCTVIAVEVAKKLLPMRGGRLVALALVAGLAATWLLATRPTLQLWLRYLTPAPLVFVLVFALASPSASLVRPGGDAPVAGASGQVGSGRAPPVVMLFFDEFPTPSLLDRHGRIDARMYPNFARLAGGSTWYRNATAVNGYTPYAVPAMLTGRYPARAVAPIYTQFPDNLFTLLARSHQLEVSELVTQLCPPQLCQTAATRRDTGFAVVAKDLAKTWARIALPYDSQPDPDAQFVEETAEANPTAPQPKPGKLSPGFMLTKDKQKINQPLRFTQFLDGIQAGERPSFHFVHMAMPHSPWRYLPSGVTYPYPDKLFGRSKPSVWGGQRWPVEVNQQRHLLQLAFTDGLIGQMIKRLKQQGIYDEALIVVTADHGISFVPGQNYRAVGKGAAQQTAWVPLFIKQPRQSAGKVTDRNWEHVDLVPTVADALGIQVPWRVDGISALGSQTRTGTQKAFYVRPGTAGRTMLDGPSNLALALRGVTDRLLRPQDGPIGLYRIGRYGPLVGRSTAAVGVAGPSPLQVTINEPTDLRAVDLAGGQVPAMVMGKVDGSTTVRSPAIAVAVNGTIGGVSEVYPTGDDQTFAAMVPDFLFRKDGNRIELFEVDPSGGAPRLRPLRWRQ
jgi:Sulfatase